MPGPPSNHRPTLVAPRDRSKPLIGRAWSPPGTNPPSPVSITDFENQIVARFAAHPSQRWPLRRASAGRTARRERRRWRPPRSKGRDLEASAPRADRLVGPPWRDGKDAEGMEPVGIEPTSERRFLGGATCVVVEFDLAIRSARRQAYLTPASALLRPLTPRRHQGASLIV